MAPSSLFGFSHSAALSALSLPLGTHTYTTHWVALCTNLGIACTESCWDGSFFASGVGALCVAESALLDKQLCNPGGLYHLIKKEGEGGWSCWKLGRYRYA